MLLRTIHRPRRSSEGARRRPGGRGKIKGIFLLKILRIRLRTKMRLRKSWILKANKKLRFVPFYSLFASFSRS